MTEREKEKVKGGLFDAMFLQVINKLLVALLCHLGALPLALLAAESSRAYFLFLLPVQLR